MHQWRIGRNDADCVQRILGLRVSTEVERTGRCDADDVRTETLEQGPGTFGLTDVLQTLPDRDRLDRCREAALGNREDRWTPSTEKRTRTYSLPGMVVVMVRIVGVDAGAQLMMVVFVADQFTTVFGPRRSDTGRYTMNKRCGRTLQTSFYHFQRACYYGASSTCDTSSEKMNECVSFTLGHTFSRKCLFGQFGFTVYRHRKKKVLGTPLTQRNNL